MRLLLVLVLAACGSTASIEKTWRAPVLPAGQLDNVVTIFPSHDGVLRRTIEDKMAHRLIAHGVHAVPSYQILDDEDLSDREAVRSRLAALGFNGVIALRFVEAHQTVAYYPSFDMYWYGAWSEPVPQTVVRTEIDAYALRDGQLVWSGLSKSVDPSGLDQLVDDVSKVASKELAKQRVVTAAR